MGTKEITFTVIGEPKGKGRPRFRNLGKFVQTYTDKDTVNYENLVKMSYRTKCQQMMFLADEMVECEINAFYSIPKATSKKKHQLMLDRILRPTKKPDLDNLQKSLFDGLNKVAFQDDTQIVSIVCNKYYSDSPRVEITLRGVGTPNE